LEIFVKILGAVIAVLGFTFIMACLLSLPVMWLWDWLMPEIFGLTTITFWQALGLNLLSGFLIKSNSSSSSNSND